MQALNTARGLRGVSQMVKNEGKVQRGLDKGNGRILDDANENRWPAAEKEASVKKKLDKWKGRAANVGGQVEEPKKRTKEDQEEVGQHLQKVPMEISPSAQEPIYEILMDENVVENGGNVNPSLQNRNFGDQRFSNINRSAIERRDKKLIKETLIEANGPRCCVSLLPPNCLVTLLLNQTKRSCIAKSNMLPLPNLRLKHL